MKSVVMAKRLLRDILRVPTTDECFYMQRSVTCSSSEILQLLARQVIKQTTISIFQIAEFSHPSRLRSDEMVRGHNYRYEHKVGF